MWNCLLFLWVALICEVKPVYCESDLVTLTFPFVSFNPATKNGLEALRVFEVRAEVLETKCNGTSGQNLLGTNCLPLVDVIVYLLIYLWCV